MIVAVWCKKFIREDNRRSQSSSAISHETNPGMSLFSFFLLPFGKEFMHHSATGHENESSTFSFGKEFTTTELTQGHENESSTSSFNKELVHQSASDHEDDSITSSIAMITVYLSLPQSS